MVEDLHDVLPGLELETGHVKHEMLEQVGVVRLLGELSDELGGGF
jgi:hypothetical protein